MAHSNQRHRNTHQVARESTIAVGGVEVETQLTNSAPTATFLQGQSIGHAPDNDVRSFNRPWFRYQKIRSMTIIDNENITPSFDVYVVSDDGPPSTRQVTWDSGEIVDLADGGIGVIERITGKIEVREEHWTQLGTKNLAIFQNIGILASTKQVCLLLVAVESITFSTQAGLGIVITGEQAP